MARRRQESDSRLSYNSSRASRDTAMSLVNSGTYGTTLHSDNIRMSATAAAVSQKSEVDGVGVRGYLYMRPDGPSYHRMKRHYYRLVGVNLFRFASAEVGRDLSASIYEAEVTSIEEWDGKGILHRYAHAFKFHTSIGTFNVYAECQEDKELWVTHASIALEASAQAMEELEQSKETGSSTTDGSPVVLELSPGGMKIENVSSLEEFAQTSMCPINLAGAPPPSSSNSPSSNNVSSSTSSNIVQNLGKNMVAGVLHQNKLAPPFQNNVVCTHPTCNINFDTSRKRQHHCRSCGSSICSEHGAHFMPLVHIGYARAVRVCVSCQRVQRFIQLLRSLLQMYVTQRASGGGAVPIQLTEEEAEARDTMQSMVLDVDFGVSDALQALHLHRRSCDAVYAIIVEKLISFCHSHMEDFEFFLPQIFQLWATIDMTTNISKSALLAQVLMTAARKHIRMAQLIYWHARAAIDDSVGHGFGQSERTVSPTLARKFSNYKLMMLNLKALIAGASWKFTPDDDLVTTPIQCQMIQCLFRRMQKLQAIDATVGRRRSDTLGNICTAMMACGIPWDVRSTRTMKEKVDENKDASARTKVASFFQSQLEFMDQITDVAERLRHVEPVSSRKKHLPDALSSLRVPAMAFFPLGSCTERLARIVNIPVREGTVFSTKARAPTLVYFEVQHSSVDLDEVLWHRQTHLDNSSGDSFHHQSSIRRTQSMPNYDELSSLVRNELREKMLEDSGKNGGNCIESSEDILSTCSNDILSDEEGETIDDLPRRYTVAATTTTTNVMNLEVVGRQESRCSFDSVDDIINAISEEVVGRDSGRRFGGLRDVEKMTDDQLSRIASSMADQILIPGENQTFTGKAAVRWMVNNAAAVDVGHAVWVGNEMMNNGLMREANNSTNVITSGSNFQNSNSRYELTTEIVVPRSSFFLRGAAAAANLSRPVSLERQTSKPASNAVPISINSSDSFSSRSNRLMSPASRRNPTGVSSGPAALSLTTLEAVGVVLSDDGAESIKSTNVPNQPSIFDRFSPEEAMGCLSDIERKIASLESEKTREDIESSIIVLKRQMEIVCEHIILQRNKRQQAVASAFGERYEDTTKRIQQASAYGRLPGWNCIPMIAKSNDDLRQEVFCLQLMRQFQDIFDSAGVNVCLRPYNIVATSASTGFIEVIKNACSLDALKKRPGYSGLANHFRRTYSGEASAGYENAMKNFIQSMAGYSLACYFLQIKDRHNGNIMIDSDGFIIHIDYGFLLGIAPGGRFSLETAPFKLTSEMVDAMGGTESEYFKEFIVLLIQGFIALQQHADTILMMIAIMAQDSMFPCFVNRNPRDVLNRMKSRFKLGYTQRQTVKYVLNLVNRSHNSYRTRQYDRFQKLTNGICP